MPPQELGNIIVRVKSEGAEETSEQLQGMQDDEEGLVGQLTGGGEGGGAGGAGGGPGGMMGGLMSAITGMSTAMMAAVAVLGVIAGILLSMESIQSLLSAFMKVVQAFFLPLAMMLIKLLGPVLRALVKLLPKWLEFWRDPIGNIKEALSGLPDLIGGFFQDAGESIKNQLYDFGGWLKDKITSGADAIGNWFDANIVQPIKGAWNGFVNWLKEKFSWIPGVDAPDRGSQTNIPNLPRGATRTFPDQGQQGGRSWEDKLIEGIKAGIPPLRIYEDFSDLADYFNINKDPDSPRR